MQFLMKALTVAVLVSAPIMVQADTASCKNMFKASPQKVADFERTGDRDYESESPGFGYGVTYRNNQGSVTVFYYDGGSKRISDAMVLKNFEKAMKDIVRIAKKNDRGVGKFRKSTVNDDGTAIQMMAIAKDTNQRMQLVAMGAKNDCMLKVRLSTSSSRDETKQLLTKFMSALEPGIYNTSGRGSGKKS